MFSLSRDRWRKLDNAAKIFPATSSHRDTRVFRFYCECCDPIEPDALQDALDITIKKYPMFLSVLRKGVFWFYMEQSNLRPVVEEEDTQPCLLLYHHDKKTLLFKVTYYKNRINLEVFHALTDGTGASQFLRELVRNYLVCRYPQAKLPDVSFTEPDMTVQDQETDGFTKYYKKEFKKTEKKPKAFQLTGPKTAHGELNITEGRVSCKALLAKAK
ncbi:MAG: hypothetical protein GX567_14645, partial [Clostridia bacterium]|nr:hypothetical protein [Clostridia bacterium]